MKVDETMTTAKLQRLNASARPSGTLDTRRTFAATAQRKFCETCGSMEECACFVLGEMAPYKHCNICPRPLHRRHLRRPHRHVQVGPKLLLQTPQGGGPMLAATNARGLRNRQQPTVLPIACPSPAAPAPLQLGRVVRGNERRVGLAAQMAI